MTRSWLLENEHLVLRFDIKNKTTQPVDIGALGIPMVFNNIITDRTFEQAHADMFVFRSVYRAGRRLFAGDAT